MDWRAWSDETDGNRPMAAQYSSSGRPAAKTARAEASSHRRGGARPGSAPTQTLHGPLAVAAGVVDAERDRPAIWQQFADAAFACVVQVKRPRVHEVAAADHENVLAQIAAAVSGERQTHAARSAAVR